MKTYYVEFVINGQERWTSVEARNENEAEIRVYHGLLHIGYAENIRCYEC